jgi:hypothetical protein
VQYVPYAERLFLAGCNVLDAPTVWNYDVIEAFGQWYANAILSEEPGEEVPMQDCRDKLCALAFAFFEQGIGPTEAGLVILLRTALNAVPTEESK